VRRGGPKASEDDVDEESTMTTSRLPQPSQPSQRPPPLGGADGSILLLSCGEGGWVDA